MREHEALNPDATTIVPTIFSPSSVAEATVNGDDQEAPTDPGYNDEDFGPSRLREMEEEQVELLRRQKQATKERRKEAARSVTQGGCRPPTHRPRIWEHLGPLAQDQRSKQSAWSGLCQAQMDKRRPRVFFRTRGARKGRGSARENQHKRRCNWRAYRKRIASGSFLRRGPQRNRRRAGAQRN